MANKKYKEALNLIRSMVVNGHITQEIAEKYFPELKESENEKIRKELIQNLKERFGTHGSMGGILDMPRVLAWLEKQGEQKPVEPQQNMLSQEKYAKAVDECIYGEQMYADKVEPKFHEGEWITIKE